MVEVKHTIPRWDIPAATGVALKERWTYFWNSGHIRDFYEARLGMVLGEEKSLNIAVADPSQKPCSFLSREIRESEITGIPKGITECCAHPNQRNLILLHMAMWEFVAQLQAALIETQDVMGVAGLIHNPRSHKTRLEVVQKTISKVAQRMEQTLKTLKPWAAASDKGEMTSQFEVKERGTRM